MAFLAVLEYEHMDNGMFLAAFARSLAQQKSRGIIIHGDSAYTERLIQTGLMREDATKRAIKDLNHRLVALFADQGVSTIALNGYQKSLITLADNQVEVDSTQLRNLPEQPMLLISNLLLDRQMNEQVPLPLPGMAYALQQALDIEDITIFSIKEDHLFRKEDLPEIIKPKDLSEEFKTTYIPQNFREISFQVRLATADSFGNKVFP